MDEDERWPALASVMPVASIQEQPVDTVDIVRHTHLMTQSSTTKTEIPAADITAEMLRTTDLDTIVVVTPSGKRIGDMPSITFGLGSWDGDYDGFADWLNTQA